MFVFKDLMVKVTAEDGLLKNTQNAICECTLDPCTEANTGCWMCTQGNWTCGNCTEECTCTCCTGVTDAQSACCEDKLTGSEEKSENRIADLSILQAILLKKLTAE